MGSICGFPPRALLNRKTKAFILVGTAPTAGESSLITKLDGHMEWAFPWGMRIFLKGSYCFQQPTFHRPVKPVSF